MEGLIECFLCQVKYHVYAYKAHFMQYGNIKTCIVFFTSPLSLAFSVVEACRQNIPSLPVCSVFTWCWCACISEIDPSAWMLLSCPWWALCFTPQTQTLIISHNRAVSLLSLQLPSISLISVFLSDLHKLNILSASASPTASARSRSVSLSLPTSLPPCVSVFFAVALVTQPGSRQHNVKLLLPIAEICLFLLCDFSLILFFSVLCLQLFFFLASQPLSLHGHWHRNFFFSAWGNLSPPGRRDIKLYSYHSLWLLLGRRTQKPNHILL